VVDPINAAGLLTSPRRIALAELPHLTKSRDDLFEPRLGWELPVADAVGLQKGAAKPVEMYAIATKTLAPWSVAWIW